MPYDVQGSAWQGPKSSLTDSFRRTLKESMNGALRPSDDAADLNPILVDEEAQTRKNGLSFPMTVFFLVAQMAGAGFLALPAAMKNTGWIGIPMMVLFCTAVGYSGTRLGKCWVLMEKHWKEYQQPARQPYMEIVNRAFGLSGRRAALGLVVFTLFGTTTVFIILISNMMESLVQVENAPSPCMWTIIVACCLVPVSWLGTPKDFWQISLVAVFSTVLACAVIVVQVILEAPNQQQIYHPNPSVSSFFLGFGAILFSFGGAAVFPTIQNDMQDRSKFGKSVLVAFGVILSLYLPVSIAGYGVFGTNVNDNILMNVEGIAVNVARGMEVVNLLGTFLISFNPVAQSLEEAFNLPQHFCWQRCVLRTVMVGLELLMALAVPSFGVIINFFGGSTVTSCTFLFPPFCYIKICNLKDEKGEPFRVIPLWEKVLLFQIVVIGLLGGIATTVFALMDMLDPSSYSVSCFS
ncbi:uncharacterized protein LOC143018586 isoform X2 [Oratosquilla oratoria]